MKYLKIYIITLFSSLLLFSCTESESVQELPGTEEVGKVYITFSFLQNSGSNTRTEGTLEDDLSIESGISHIRVILVDEKQVANEVYAGTVQWDGSAKTLPIQVKSLNTGNYHLYLLANADGLSFSSTNLETATGCLSPASAEGMEKLCGDYAFLMANKNNTPQDVNTKFYGGIPVIVDGTKGTTIDDPLEVAVDLERLACKIEVNPLSPDAKLSIQDKHFQAISRDFYYSIDKVALDGIGLLNCVTNYNSIQQWGKGELYSSNSKDMLLQTPSTIPSYSVSDDNYYNRISAYQDGINKMFKSPDEVLYCMENNSPRYEILNTNVESALWGTRMKGRTTGVLFKVKARIVKRYTENEDIIPDDPNNPGQWTTTKAVTNSDAYPTFYRYVNTLYATRFSLLAEHPELKLGENPTVEALRKAGVEVYEDGTMYYLYWIGDDYYTDGGKPYYAVTRNTWYHLTIQDIKTIGADIPGGRDYKETDPIEYETNYIAVNLQYAGWDVINIPNRPIK